jgi:hypothetical protein
MREIQGDIWATQCDWLCITTNGMVRNDGRAVMGRGIARQAKDLIPDIDLRLASSLVAKGNVVSVIALYQNKWIISFPTKNDWRMDSDLELIKQSALQLKAHFDNQSSKPTVLLPRPGCANGHLNWSEVKNVIAPILTDEEFIIVNRFS